MTIKNEDLKRRMKLDEFYDGLENLSETEFLRKYAPNEVERFKKIRATTDKIYKLLAELPDLDAMRIIYFLDHRLKNDVLQAFEFAEKTVNGKYQKESGNNEKQ